MKNFLILFVFILVQFYEFEAKAEFQSNGNTFISNSNVKFPNGQAINLSGQLSLNPLTDDYIIVSSAETFYRNLKLKIHPVDLAELREKYNLRPGGLIRAIEVKCEKNLTTLCSIVSLQFTSGITPLTFILKSMNYLNDHISPGYFRNLYSELFYSNGNAYCSIGFDFDSFTNKILNDLNVNSINLIREVDLSRLAPSFQAHGKCKYEADNSIVGFSKYGSSMVYYSNGVEKCYLKEDLMGKIFPNKSHLSLRDEKFYLSGKFSYCNFEKVPSGHFLVGPDVYYSNGSAYCLYKKYDPNINLNPKSNFPSINLKSYDGEPINMENHGDCQK